MRSFKQYTWSRATLVLICIAVATLLLAISPRDEVFADDKNSLPSIETVRSKSMCLRSERGSKLSLEPEIPTQTISSSPE